METEQKGRLAREGERRPQSTEQKEKAQKTGGRRKRREDEARSLQCGRVSTEAERGWGPANAGFVSL